jgi:hypothetical protein
MTYRKEGKYLAHGKGKVNILVKYCGWLSSRRTFPTGTNKTSASAVKRMADQIKMAMTRGHHTCELCGWCDSNYGNGEMWIEVHGTIWLLPRMIWHYMESHEYALPPEVDTALSGGTYSIADKMPVQLQSCPAIETTMLWNEIRYKNLSTFNNSIFPIWNVGTSHLINGKYQITFDHPIILDTECMLEEYPQDFPDEILIRLAIGNP